MATMLTFYNPGLKIAEMLAYDHPFRIKQDPRHVQPAYHQIHVEEGEFFEVPATVTIVDPDSGSEQEAPIPQIYHRMMALYRERGLVLVEKESERPKTRKGDDHIADTKREAKELGDEYHRTFLLNKVREWYQIVERVRSEGGVPTAATGLYKHALKKLQHSDPADRVDAIEHERKSSGDSRDTNKRIDELTAQVNRLLGMNQALIEKQIEAK